MERDERGSTEFDFFQPIDDLMEVKDEMGSVRDEKSVFTLQA